MELMEATQSHYVCAWFIITLMLTSAKHWITIIQLTSISQLIGLRTFLFTHLPTWCFTAKIRLHVHNPVGGKKGAWAAQDVITVAGINLDDISPGGCSFEDGYLQTAMYWIEILHAWVVVVRQFRLRWLRRDTCCVIGEFYVCVRVLASSWSFA